MGNRKSKQYHSKITLTCENENVVQFYLVIYHWFFFFGEMHGFIFQIVSITGERHEKLLKNKGNSYMQEKQALHSITHEGWRTPAHSYSCHEQEIILRLAF